MEEGSGTTVQGIGRPAAGKTGTSTDSKGNIAASWFVGYTPQMATAVMYSRGDGNDPLNGYLEPFFGSSYPARTWLATMTRLMQGVPIEDFPPPAFVEATNEESEELPTFTPEPQPEPTRTRRPSPTATPSQEPTTSAPPEPSPEPTPGPPSPTECNPLDPACGGGEESTSPTPNGNGNGNGNGG